MMKLAKKQPEDKTSRQIWVYGELNRLYPPLDLGLTLEKISHSGGSTNEKISHSDDGQIQGLSNLPTEWAELPANASFSSEVGWVQANRPESYPDPMQQIVKPLFVVITQYQLAVVTAVMTLDRILPEGFSQAP